MLIFLDMFPPARQNYDSYRVAKCPDSTQVWTIPPHEDAAVEVTTKANAGPPE